MDRKEFESILTIGETVAVKIRPTVILKMPIKYR